MTQSTTDRLRKRRRADVVEDTAELAAFGLTGDAIADRLGMTWEGVCRAHHRAGVPIPVRKNADAFRYTRHDRRATGNKSAAVAVARPLQSPPPKRPRNAPCSPRPRNDPETTPAAE